MKQTFHTKYWKHINENNRLINIKTIPDDEYYPWDILDTSKLTSEQQKIIHLFREQMGIPIAIDKIVKAYGIPIGERAMKEWLKFRAKTIKNGGDLKYDVRF